MIKLHGTSGVAIYVNPDKIIGFNEEVNNGGSYINYGRDQYVVTESPEEVARKVLEYKLAMINFNHDSVSPQAEKILYDLAGLEESQ